MKKHAYLIMAHNEPEILRKLISLLDDVRNDIYLHIDKKTDMAIFGNIETKYSKVTYVRRNNVYWGGLSQIRCELTLFEEAARNGHYGHYHLLSGSDFPLKSQNYIHWFMDEKFPCSEFVGFMEDNKDSVNDIEFKTQFYHFVPSFAVSNHSVSQILNRFNNFCVRFQRLLKIRRKYSIELKKGPNWVSITDEFCRYLLSHKRDILKMFKFTLCSDEMFLQTFLWKSEFKDNIYNLGKGEYEECLRYVKWRIGEKSPKTLTKEDLNEVLQSNAIFARKFSQCDMTIVDYLIKELPKSTIPKVGDY